MLGIHVCFVHLERLFSLGQSSTYSDTIRSLASHVPKRNNVIIAESEEHLMDEVLTRLASKRRPRENKQMRRELDLSPTFDTKRTFVCEAPVLLMANSVARR